MQASDRRCDQTRLSMLSWNAGLKKGKVTNTVVGSYHTLRLQESESDFDGIAEIAAEQFHINRSADQLILFHEKTFEPGGVTTEGEIPGTSKQASFSLKCLMVKVCVKAATQAQKNDVHSCLFSPEQRDEARHRKTTSGPVQGNH